VSKDNHPQPKADTAKAGHHGGDVWGASRSLNRPLSEILDLSASLNPLGPPPGLKEVVMRAYDSMDHYPDRGTHDLRRALADWLGISPQWLLAGNGSTALIQLITRAIKPNKTVIYSPAFGEFYRALELNGWGYAPCYLAEKNAFAPGLADLEAAWRLEPDCLIMTNPISPSGTLVAMEVLDAALEQAQSRNAWLIVDEAFIDFAPHEARHWSLARLAQYPRLLVLRSLTKFYCLAGLRLGFVMAQPRSMEKLIPWSEPWSVNTLAQAAGEYCVRQTEYAAKTRQAVNRFREQMVRRLEALGMELYPSQVNYLLMKLPKGGPTAKELTQACFPHGVLLRDCASFEGCTKRHLRIAVCNPEQQERLFGLMQSLLG
jgi:threonine-phosphate decarboxylase